MHTCSLAVTALGPPHHTAVWMCLLMTAHLVHERLQAFPLLLAAQGVDGRQLGVRGPQLLQPAHILPHCCARASQAVQQRQLSVRAPAAQRCCARCMIQAPHSW